MSQQTDKLTIFQSGPCGGAGGFPFSMNVTNSQNPKLVKIQVHSGWTIDAISVLYQVSGNLISSPRWGGPGGETTEITLGADEILISVNGFASPYEILPFIVRSLTFVTNLTTYGPYGRQEGVPFTLPAGLGKIVGFHGRSGKFLDSIGIYVQPIDPNSFIKPASQPVPNGTFRVQNLDALVSSLSSLSENVVLVSDDSYDESQEWVKDTRYIAYTDKDGQPGFTLLHKQSNKYLLHEDDKLVLAAKDPKELEQSALWTEGPQDLMNGFRDIRALNDTDLVLNFNRGNSTSVDAAPVGLTRVSYDQNGNLILSKGICWKLSLRS